MKACAADDFHSLSPATRDLHTAVERECWLSMYERGYLLVEPDHIDDPIVFDGLRSTDPFKTLCTAMACAPCKVYTATRICIYLCILRSRANFCAYIRR